MEEQKTGLAKYFWQVTYAHTIAYFIAGVFAVAFMSYDALWEREAFGSFMRPINDPLIALGPALNIFRGALYALIFLPLRKPLFEEKYGLLKLAVLLVGLTYLATFGPGIGSFEGFIYTMIPIRYQIWGWPEMLLWVASFVGILHLSIKFSRKKIVTILPIIIVLLIVFMGIMGFISLAAGDAVPFVAAFPS